MAGIIPDPELGSLQIEIKNIKFPLLISFAGLGDHFQFRNILSDLDVNVIYLRDLKHNWYLNGIPSVGDNVNEIVEFLNNKIKEANYPKVITIGASAGGFAALLFGSLLNVNQIMAFSPQTFMNKFQRILYYDHRWTDRVNQIYMGERANRLFLDVKEIVRKFSGTVDLYYDKITGLTLSMQGGLKAKILFITKVKAVDITLLEN